MHVQCVVPIRTVNELNAHEHWRVRLRRSKAQHAAIALVLSQFNGVKASMKPPYFIQLDRVSPGKLDQFDGLPSAFKFVIDAICKWLGVDDGSDAISGIDFTQRTGAPREYAVGIWISGKTEEEAAQ